MRADLRMGVNVLQGVLATNELQCLVYSLHVHVCREEGTNFEDPPR